MMTISRVEDVIAKIKERMNDGVLEFNIVELNDQEILVTGGYETFVTGTENAEHITEFVVMYSPESNNNISSETPEQNEVNQEEEMIMKNTTITKVNESYYIVRATTERFGKNEIMYEGTTFEAAETYALTNGATGITLIGFEKSELSYIASKLADDIIEKMGTSRTAVSKWMGTTRQDADVEVAEQIVTKKTDKWMSKLGMERVINGISAMYRRKSEVGS